MSEDDLAPAVSVRLRRSILAKVEARAADSGVNRSDVIRGMVEQALATARKGK